MYYLVLAPYQAFLSLGTELPQGRDSKEVQLVVTWKWILGLTGPVRPDFSGGDVR